MEKRKLMLVVISVGVFLVIAIGATMLIFAPSKNANERTPVIAGMPSNETATPSAPASVDASEWARNPQSVSGLQPPAQTSSASHGDVIIIYGERPPQDDGSAQAVAQDDGSVSINVPQPPKTTIPEPENTPEMGAEKMAGTPVETNSAPAPAPKTVATTKQSPPKQTAPTTSTSTKKTQTVKPAAKPAPKILVDTYWVQTGSFAAKTRAEAVKTQLSEKGISSLVETKELSGKTFYRVRVGPYSSKNEADYWLSLVKTIEGFGESYISVTKTKK